MRQTASIKEIAQATGKVPTTIGRKLKKRGCVFGWDKGKGGYEHQYLVSFLPKEYRIALAAMDAKPSLGNPMDVISNIGVEAATEIRCTNATVATHAQIAKEEGLAAFERLPEERKREARARHDLLLMCNGFVEAAGFEIRRYASRSKKGDAAFVDAYNSGKVQISDDIAKVVGEKTSVSTIRRIHTAHYKYGIAGLAFNYHNPKRGGTSLTDEMQKFVIAAMCKQPKTSSKNIRRALQGATGCMDIEDLPSTGVITRFRNRWIRENQDLWLYYTNPNGWKSKKMFAFGSANHHIIRLNQLWEADSTPADVMLKDGRHSIIGMIDIYSRRVRLVVSKTSRAVAVVALIRKCLLDWGVPEIIKTDNGNDYTSKHVVRVIHDLSIDQQLCTPFESQEKPHIERVFRTFSHGLAEFLPGYIGHNVNDRKEIEDRRSFADRIMSKGSNPVEVGMDAKQLQQYCDEWTDYIYHHDSHDGLGGSTPAEMARNWTEPIRRIQDERALDMLLMPASRDGGIRTIRKKGVAVDGRYYQSPDFAGFVGEKVFVLLDPTDLGTAYIYLEKPDGEREFLCPAIDPIWHGIDPAEFAIVSKKHQQKLMKQGRRELIKLTKEISIQEAHDHFRELRKAQVENIIDLPSKVENHVSDGLDQGAAAANAIEALNAETKAQENFTIEFSDEELATVPAPQQEEKIIHLRTDSDSYEQIWIATREPGRKLSEFEYDFLGKYYETNTGSMYLELQGDLRELIGLQKQDQAEA